jgi:hypothetical protein
MTWRGLWRLLRIDQLAPQYAHRMPYQYPVYLHHHFVITWIHAISNPTNLGTKQDFLSYLGEIAADFDCVTRCFTRHNAHYVGRNS